MGRLRGRQVEKLTGSGVAGRASFRKAYRLWPPWSRFNGDVLRARLIGAGGARIRAGKSRSGVVPAGELLGLVFRARTLTASDGVAVDRERRWGLAWEFDGEAETKRAR